MGRLDGKVAIVTGGAQGQGAGIVRAFLAEGARVVVADVAEEPGEALVAEMTRQHGDSAEQIGCEGPPEYLEVDELGRFGVRRLRAGCRRC